MLGDVLEREQEPGAAARRLEVRRAQADVDLAAPSAGAVAGTRGARALAAVRPWSKRIASAGAAAAARRRSAGRRRDAERQAGDRLGGAVERQDALRRIGRRQAARQAVDDVLVERLQVGDLGRRLLEPGAGRPQAVRRASRSAAPRRRTRRRSARRCTARPTRGGSASAVGGEPRIVQQPGRRQVLREHEADVEHGAERRDEQAAAAELDDAGGDDRQHVQRREVAGDAAGEVDERRDDQRVAGQLQVDQPAVPLDEAQRRARRRSSARR